MDSNELYQLMGWGEFYVNIDWSGLGWAEMNSLCDYI